MKIRQGVLALCLSIMVIGCASSSMIVTGVVRKPTDANAVRLVTALPENCEVIAIVNASSDAGFTDQGSCDYAVRELKRRAASVGANAVLIESLGSRTGDFFYSNGVLIPEEEQVVAGKAIYIPDLERSVDEPVVRGGALSGLPGQRKDDGK